MTRSRASWRNRKVALDEDEVNLQFVNETTDSLHFTYTADDHLRHGLLTWVPVPGTATAQVEVAITGRRSTCRACRT